MDATPPTFHCDLTVHGAAESWQEVRWALFVFPDIADVIPTDDPDVVRVLYEGARPYPDVWRVELRQRGFDVPAVALCNRRGDGEGPPRDYAGAPAGSSSYRG